MYKYKKIMQRFDVILLRHAHLNGAAYVDRMMTYRVAQKSKPLLK